MVRRSGKKWIVAAGTALLMAGLVSSAWADGESRPAKPAEEELHRRVMTAFDQSVPAGPAGWNEVERSVIEPLERVGVGAEEVPFTVDFHVRWEDSQRLEEAEQRALTVGGNIMQQQQAENPMEAQQKKMEALINQLGPAIERNDMAEMQRIQAELDKLGQEMKPIQEARDAELNQAFEESAAHDAELGIRINANRFYMDFVDEVTEEPAVAGRPVYRTEGEWDSSRGWNEGISTVFLGKWTMEKEGDYTRLIATEQPGAPYTRIQTIMVTVQGDQARARQALEAMDWDLLKGLMNQ